MIFLDHHSTTPLDPQVLQAMLPLLTEQFANPGSINHAAGRQVAEIVEAAIAGIARGLGASSEEIIVTSGATESNNLALFGCMQHPRQKRRKIISVVTEHKAILDPLLRLEHHGFEVVRLPVQPQSSSQAGRVDLQQLAEAVDDNTALVSVMLANNEIGALQPLKEIAQECRRVGCWLHTDATQAVGRLAVDVDDLDVDMLSFSAHKFYGPKGVGGLFVRRRQRRVRLQSQIVGGGQQHNFRSGTLNTAGIVGMQAALHVCLDNLSADQRRIRELRNQLYETLKQSLDWITLNGPMWTDELADNLQRLPGNLNCGFFPLEGQSLMLAVPDLAVSSGSACTTADPAPSHVLQALGLSQEQARSSLRFGIGRFTTQSEISQAAQWLIDAAESLQKLL